MSWLIQIVLRVLSVCLFYGFFDVLQATDTYSLGCQPSRDTFSLCNVLACLFYSFWKEQGSFSSVKQYCTLFL